jgi:hypothetical protein
MIYWWDVLLQETYNPARTTWFPMHLGPPIVCPLWPRSSTLNWHCWVRSGLSNHPRLCWCRQCSGKSHPSARWVCLCLFGFVCCVVNCFSSTANSLCAQCWCLWSTWLWDSKKPPLMMTSRRWWKLLLIHPNTRFVSDYRLRYHLSDLFLCSAMLVTLRMKSCLLISLVIPFLHFWCQSRYFLKSSFCEVDF